MNIREAFQFLRVLLDARSGRGTLICGITSPTAGDGKTTISIRLARSFAAAQRRVLLIDADLVGRGATRSCWTSRRGRSRRLEFRTLDQSIVEPRGRGIRLHPGLARRGRVGDLLRACARRDARRDAFQIRRRPRRHRADPREHRGCGYDPHDGSDATRRLPRGLESRLLRMATDRLRELNARSVGLVFNRATTIDFNRSFAPPSSTSRRSTTRGLTATKIADVRESMDEESPGES
jgi:hypothetical protein